MHNPDYTLNIFVKMHQREIQHDVERMRLAARLKRTGLQNKPLRIMKSVFKAILRRRIAPLATPITSPMMVTITEKIKDNDKCCPNPA